MPCGQAAARCRGGPGAPGEGEEGAPGAARKRLALPGGGVHLLHLLIAVIVLLLQLVHGPGNLATGPAAHMVPDAARGVLVHVEQRCAIVHERPDAGCLLGGGRGGDSKGGENQVSTCRGWEICGRYEVLYMRCCDSDMMCVALLLQAAGYATAGCKGYLIGREI